jgi:glucose-6-phosphate isomerase
MTIDAQALHEQLREARAELGHQQITALFDADPQRHERYQCQSNGLVVDFSKHLINDHVWQSLIELASAHALPDAFTALVAGHCVNRSEGRPALHTLLRGTAVEQHPESAAAVHDALARMETLVTRLHKGEDTGWTEQAFTDVVNIGIGGSDLGPRFICDALKTPEAPLRAHFVANVDPEDLDRTLASLDPARTLFVVCSKSFTTEETLSNARRAKAWLQAAGAPPNDLGQHFLAVTTQVTHAQQWGIPEARCLPIWDWVGGRYSLWSAMGLTIPLALGWSAFEALLRGARALDQHTLESPPADNVPIMMALLEFWQTRYLSTNTHAVLPYAQRLQHLTDFLQQLTMESNGKRVSTSGEPLSSDSAPVLWGSVGTNGQHSYYQLLHQGTRSFSADIIFPLISGGGDLPARRSLAAHALAQSRAFMVGRSPDEAKEIGASRGFNEGECRQLEMPGNHSHSLILMDAVTPECLGSLIAAYEHKTYFLAVLLGVNAFDQWGVELGKEIAATIEPLLRTGAASIDSDALDPATRQAAMAWHQANEKQDVKR